MACKLVGRMLEIVALAEYDCGLGPGNMVI